MRNELREIKWKLDNYVLDFPSRMVDGAITFTTCGNTDYFHVIPGIGETFEFSFYNCDGEYVSIDFKEIGVVVSGDGDHPSYRFATDKGFVVNFRFSDNLESTTEDDGITYYHAENGRYEVCCEVEISHPEACFREGE